MNFDSVLQSENIIRVQQKKELTELVGIETRNKYSLETKDGTRFGFVAEQGKSLGESMARMFLGHWRTFDLHFYDNNRQKAFQATHPFRFFFQRLEITHSHGAVIGAIQQRFSFLIKRFDILDPRGQVRFTMNSPFWKIWTFPIKKDNMEIAVIRKKWSGLMKEAFTDADLFSVEFNYSGLSLEDKKLILAASIFVDLLYFEKKAGNNR